MESSEVSIKTRSTPASLSFKGQATKHATVKWSIVKMATCAYIAVHHHEVPEGIIELKSECSSNVRPWSFQKSPQQHMDINHGITQLPKYRLLFPFKFAPHAV